MKSLMPMLSAYRMPCISIDVCKHRPIQYTAPTSIYIRYLQHGGVLTLANRMTQ